MHGDYPSKKEWAYNKKKLLLIIRLLLQTNKKVCLNYQILILCWGLVSSPWEKVLYQQHLNIVDTNISYPSNNLPITYLPTFFSLYYCLKLFFFWVNFFVIILHMTANYNLPRVLPPPQSFCYSLEAIIFSQKLSPTISTF